MAESIEVRVPDIGDFKDVPVIDVLVKPGETINRDDSIITLESEKASMEVPSPMQGVVKEIKVKAGDKVSQGNVILTLEEQPAQAKAPADAAPAPSPHAAPVSSPAPPSPSVSEQPREATAPSAAAPPVHANGAIHASPSIRRFARELGVDLRGIQPSGPNGRVTRQDVQNFVKRAVRDGSETARIGGAFNVLPLPTVDFSQFGEVERKPLSRIKRLSGPNLHRNWVTIPHVTQNDDADVTELEEFRRTLNAEMSKSGVKVTMLAFLIKAAVAALKAFPEFNSSLDGDELVFKKYYNIGFAADTPGGLLVPVVRDADRKGIADLARETSELAASAREGKLSSAQMQAGTFTISSLGSIGGTYFTPIINAPEVAILGACRAAMRPVWDGSSFVPRLMQPLSLSYDHRVIDGAAAARFITYLGGVLSDLRRALL